VGSGSLHVYVHCIVFNCILLYVPRWLSSTPEPVIPLVDWHRLTYLVLTCRKTPIKQSISFPFFIPLRSALFISDSSIKYHVYADDTQLSMSFSVPEFSQNIFHNEAGPIDTVYSWVSVYLLSVNQSKTELLLGLPKHIIYSLFSCLSISPLFHLTARNLGVIYWLITHYIWSCVLCRIKNTVHSNTAHAILLLLAFIQR